MNVAPAWSAENSVPYRYLLTRSWLVGCGTLLFVMLNPSIADETADDPTIRRCVRFASDLGFRALHVVNLFAWRATDPKELRRAALAGEDVVGFLNDETIARELLECDVAVAAWGSAAAFAAPRIRHVTGMLSMRRSVHVRCLGLTQSGQPRHPLFVPASKQLEPWP